MTIRNMNESIEWYTRHFDFEVIKRYQKRGSEIVHLQSGNIRIELFDYGADTKQLPEYRKDLWQDLHAVGTKHLCIEVDNLDGKLEELKKGGVEIVKNAEEAGFGGRFAFIKDCNGILIELYQS